MKITKKSFDSVPLEIAHGWAGARRLYVDKGEINNSDWEALTYWYLPANGIFDWHFHWDVEEIMFVIKWNGTVSDEDGVYDYAKGDVFIFPANVKHKIENTSNEEHEYIFIRTAMRK